MNNVDRIMDQLEGAVIVSGRVDEGEGLCLNLDNGYVLIIAGMFSLAVMRLDVEKLH